MILPTNLQTQRAEDNDISLEIFLCRTQLNLLFPAEFVSLQDNGRCRGVWQRWAAGLSLQSLQLRGGQREVERQGGLGELTEQGGGVGGAQEA